MDEELRAGGDDFSVFGTGRGHFTRLLPWRAADISPSGRRCQAIELGSDVPQMCMHGHACVASTSWYLLDLLWAVRLS